MTRLARKIGRKLSKKMGVLTVGNQFDLAYLALLQTLTMTKFRFGKHPAKHDYRTLRFKNYLKAGITAPPAQYDVLATVYKNLGISDPSRVVPHGRE